MILYKYFMPLVMSLLEHNIKIKPEGEGGGDGAGTSSKSKQGTLAAKLGHTNITVYLPYHDIKLYWHRN